MTGTSRVDSIKDATILKVVAMPCAVAMYTVYVIMSPNADGIAFGTMMGLLGLLAGVPVGRALAKGEL